MGKQINFYLDQSDYGAVIDPIVRGFGLSFFTRTAMPLCSSVVGKMGEEPLHIYISFDHFVGKMSFTEQGDIDEMFSPVIKFSRCYQNNEVLRRGRFYVSTGHFNSSSVYVDQEKEIVEAASKLIRKLRSKLKKSHDCYASNSALEWLKGGNRKFEN